MMPFSPPFQDGDPTSVSTSLLFWVTILSALVVLFILSSATRIVPEYQRLVVFRLGRLVGVVGPGIVFLLPFIDRAIKVDLREYVLRNTFAATTRDSLPVAVDCLWYCKVVDPVRSVVDVNDLQATLRLTGEKIVRTLAAAETLDQLRGNRQQLEETIRAQLHEAAQRWGAAISRVEIMGIERA